MKKGARPPKKAKREESKKKLMYCLFFDGRGAIYQHFVPRGTTVNTATYIHILQKFESLHRSKRPERYGENAEAWFFHQDNAPAHASGDTTMWLDAAGVNVLKHAPYSPDLAVRNSYDDSDLGREPVEDGVAELSPDELSDCVGVWVNVGLCLLLYFLLAMRLLGIPGTQTAPRWS